jgi:ATP-binding cassette subfamily B protein
MLVAPAIGVVIVATIIPITLVRNRRNKVQEAVNKKSEPIDRIAYRTRWYLLDPANMPEVRLIGGFKNLVHSWRVNMKKSQDMQFEVDKQSAKFDLITDVIQPFIEFAANIYFFRLLVAGTIGLDRFIFLRSILDQASTSASSITTSLNRLHELSLDLENFDKFRRTEPAIPNGAVKVTRPLTIEFRNVYFTYPAAKTPTLNDVSFLIVPGSKLALVGENGAGKTTLIKLLLRQYLPSSGQILVNGTDIRDINQESYYESLSILSQDFLKVYHLTVRENLLLGVGREVEDKELIDCLDMVGALEFVQKLPHKLDQRMDSSF